MSMFGAPKQILSDQGKEVMNETIRKLTELTGVEHRVASAYNPRTNGLTEKFNHTLINSLKKHAEEDPVRIDPASSRGRPLCRS